MSISHTIPAKEVWDITEELVDRITTSVAEKIKALNGDKSVSATFVVGGGGKIHGFTEMLADKLGLPHEQCGTSWRRSITGSTLSRPISRKIRC